LKRIPINERALPNYSRGEEITNMVTHIIGVAIGFFTLVMGVIISKSHNDPWAVVGSIIYGISMISLFAVSSIYHGLKPCFGKKVMQVIDHCTIYFLIAGTYTPIILSAIRPVYPTLAWGIFAAEWGLTALAVTLTAIDLKKYYRFSMFCYLAMGWIIILAIKPAIEVMSIDGLLLLLYGGIVYTIGAVLYAIGKKKKYLHSVFHVFVDVGCILQAVCILKYVI